MDRDLAALSKSIDPAVLGARIRAARVAAGMTQADLAEGLASAAYVSRIESGARRPDTPLLQGIASKLGVSLDELLRGVSRHQMAEWELELDYAELAVNSGEADDGLRRVRRLLGDPQLAEAPDLHRAALSVEASGLEAVGDVGTAIHALESLVETGPHDQKWLRALIALSRCYRYSGDLNRAVDIGVRARTAIEDSGLEGTGEAIQLTLTVAAAHFLRGDTAYAAEICRRAIREAEARGDALTQAAAYWNASVVESRRGNTAEALPLARKALAVYEVGEDARNLARLRTQVAMMELRLDPPEPESAMASLELAQRELGWSNASPADRADTMIALAHAHHLLGDASAAKELLADGLALVSGGAPMSAASAMVLRGQIAMAEGDLRAARDAYQGAVEQLTGAGADRTAGELWFELAGALDAAGLPEDAKEAYRSAAAAAGLAVRGGTASSVSPVSARG